MPDPGWSAREPPSEIHTAPQQNGWLRACVQRTPRAAQLNGLQNPRPGVPRENTGNGSTVADNGVLDDKMFRAADSETYLKDIHWLVQKISLISEKSMLILDEVHMEQMKMKAQVAAHTNKMIDSGPDYLAPKSEVKQDDQPLNAEHTQSSLEKSCGQSALKSSLYDQFVMVTTENLEARLKQIDAREQSMQEVLSSVSTKLDEMGASIVVKQQDFVSPLLRTDYLRDDAVINPEEAAVVDTDKGMHDKVSDATVKKPDEVDAAREEKGPDEVVALCDLDTQSQEADPLTVAPSELATASGKLSNAVFLDVDDQDVGTQPLVTRIVMSWSFELVFALLIVLNTLIMCVEAEYKGYGTGSTLGVGDMKELSQVAKVTLSVKDYFFGVLFTIEVCLKLVALGWRFWRSGWNLFDFALITLNWLSVLVQGLKLPISPMLFRLLRLIRLVRLIRSLSAFEMFDNLHLMVRGIKAAMPVLIWVVVVSFPILACSALFLNYLLVDYMVDETKPEADRLKCFDYFGTFLRSFLSMFEITFGNWVILCRFLVANVDRRFAVFFVAYKLVIGIGVVRIVYGVLLHVTFACAENDDDALIAKKERQHKIYVEKMGDLFKRFDAEGDGYLSREEFLAIGRDPRVKTWLATMDLEIHDAELVFDLADDGDGRLSAKELIYGFSRLKGVARSIDIWALITLTRKAIDKIDIITSDEKAIARKVGATVHNRHGRTPALLKPPG